MKTRDIGLTIIVMASLIFPETFGQVGISADSSMPDSTAMLDVKSTSKGFLPPRMTQAQIGEIESPADGLMVYCTTDGKLYIFSAVSELWKEVTFGTGFIAPPFTCGSTITKSHVAGPVAPVNKTVSYGTVALIPGEIYKCWITQNLGADHQATAVNDASEESAGWYWQFNRMQGYKHTGSALTPAWTITTIDENYDWLIANDPCALLLGSFWRLPTSTEWTNVDAGGAWTNWNGPWGSALKIHAAGYLSTANGSLNVRGTNGFYWSSSQFNGFTAWSLVLSNSNCSVGNYNKADGFSSRCIRDYTPSEWSCGYPITVNHVAGNVAPVSKTVTYGTVTNIPGETGKCWITQNLGADHQATAVSDATEASAGWYWQFNRMQGYKHDGTTRTPNTTWITSISENSDWTMANDPCALLLDTNWRLPTYTELHNVFISGGWTDWNGPWNSALKLHAAGDLLYSNGALYNRGTDGLYWNSTQSSNSNGFTLHFNSSSSGIYPFVKVYGSSARCLRE